MNGFILYAMTDRVLNPETAKNMGNGLLLALTAFSLFKFSGYAKKGRRLLWKKLLFGLLFISGIYVFVLLFPSLLFAHKITYRQCTVYSDQAIDPNIKNIINGALMRISASGLYDPGQHFNIYICNRLWRFNLFTQGKTLAGAVAQYDFTRYIFFRPCDIAQDRIIPPKEWYFASNPNSFKDRPLTYYFAHEMTHIMQSRYTGRGSWRYPVWLTEGYADYISKGGDFDFERNLAMWHQNAPELDPTKGLYRIYHLEVAFLLDVKQQKIKDLYRKIPDIELVRDELWALPFSE